MHDISDGCILRPIQSNDDPKKLSLGNANFLALKTFLRNDALIFHNCEIAKTYVLVNDKTKRIWGYITLMNSEIVLEKDQRPQEPNTCAKYECFPAVKIARLAIDKVLQCQGFGGKLLDWSISLVKLAVMPNVGCRFIVVDAKRGSIPFYEKGGFTLLNTVSNHSDTHPLMFLDLYKI